MARDRFIHFKKGESPSPAEIRLALEDFLGEAGRVEGDGLWLYAKLPGQASFALKRQKGVSSAAKVRAHPDGRWFEIFLGHLQEEIPKIDVITRGADEFTSALADGFKDVLASFWKGSTED